MRGRSSTWVSTLFDEALLAAGRVPENLPLDGGRVVFFWQPPSADTLARVLRRYPEAPILIGRFESETPVHEAQLAYWTATDFFPLRSMLAFELAKIDARDHWNGVPEPSVQGMSLIDGDLARWARWFELVAASAMLLVIRQAAPEIEVVTDWIGAEVARGVGLTAKRLWSADLADPNWPTRRWLREQISGQRGPRRWFRAEDTSDLAACATGAGAADIVFLLAGWVEERLLASFPIEALVERGHHCVLWVTRRTEALEALVERTQVRCEPLAYPLPATGTGQLQRQVAAWCKAAVDGGYFAPLRGALARRVVRLMGWPRWAPKLVAMHRLLRARLERERPRLLIAPAEKDWAAYCGHHAACVLGITSVGCRHGAWPAGSFPERYDHRCFFPPAPRHLLAYTPGDETLCRTASGVARPDTVVWRGNPRLDKPQARVPDDVAGESLRILVAAHGTGPGSPTAVRKRTRPLNIRLIGALFEKLGDRLRVRAHPWDSAEHFPAALRPLFLPQGEDLDVQLVRFAAVVTTYSTIAIDALAAGRPVFLWDYAGLDYDRCELAREGGLVAIVDLAELCARVGRFVDDSTYRRELLDAAARFPLYLRERLGGGVDSMRAALAEWLSSLASPAPASPAAVNAGRSATP